MKLLKRASIRTILLCSYIFLILPVVLLFSFYSFQNIVSISSENLSEGTYTRLNDLNKVLTSSLARVVEVSYFLSKDQTILENSKRYAGLDAIEQLRLEEKLLGVLNDYFRAVPEVYNVNFFLPEKKINTGRHNSVYPLEKFLQTEMAAKVSGTDQMLLEFNTIESFGVGFGRYENVITIITAIRDENTVLGYINVDLLEENLRSIHFVHALYSKDSEIYIIDSKGVIVSSGDKAQINTVLDFDNRESILYSSKGGYRPVQYGGGQSILVYSDLSKYGWRIAQMIPKSELYSDFERYIYIISLIALPVTGVMFAFSYLLARVMSKPIIVLSDIMNGFSRSSQRIPVNSGYGVEIGRLYASYNNMLERIRAEEEIRRQLDIKVLQAQINPHFLYNTLNSISWSANAIRAYGISDTIVMLSRLLRLSLNKGLSTCTAAEETEQAALYMDIQKQCHKNSFTYEIHCGEEVKALRMPKQIIQPLVENSILHGFEEISAGGVIRIRITLDETRLLVRVEDNGRGMSSGEIEGILSCGDSGGYGMKNVLDRIRYICGEEYGITYSDNPGGGVIACVTLPAARQDSDFKTV